MRGDLPPSPFTSRTASGTLLSSLLEARPRALRRLVTFPLGSAAYASDSAVTLAESSWPVRSSENSRITVSAPSALSCRTISRHASAGR